jgi:hypothetical protein
VTRVLRWVQMGLKVLETEHVEEDSRVLHYQSLLAVSLALISHYKSLKSRSADALPSDERAGEQSSGCVGDPLTGGLLPAASGVGCDGHAGHSTQKDGSAVEGLGGSEAIEASKVVKEAGADCMAADVLETSAAADSQGPQRVVWSGGAELVSPEGPVGKPLLEKKFGSDVSGVRGPIFSGDSGGRCTSTVPKTMASEQLSSDPRLEQRNSTLAARSAEQSTSHITNLRGEGTTQQGRSQSDAASFKGQDTSCGPISYGLEPGALSAQQVKQPLIGASKEASMSPPREASALDETQGTPGHAKPEGQLQCHHVCLETFF